MERITGVALLFDDGQMYALPGPKRHHHLFALVAFTGSKDVPEKQGFTTNTGRFVERKEAKLIAEAADQIRAHSGGKNHPELFSEDLW